MKPRVPREPVNSRRFAENAFGQLGCAVLAVVVLLVGRFLFGWGKP